MKTKLYLRNSNHLHVSDLRGSRDDSRFPQVEQHYQSATLHGGCGTSAKFSRPSLFRFSNDYFAEEAQRNFAVDAAIFGALIVTVLLPIVNGAEAIAGLARSLGVV